MTCPCETKHFRKRSHVMITRLGPFRLLAAAFLLSSLALCPQVVDAQYSRGLQSIDVDRIDVSHAQPVYQRKTVQQSNAANRAQPRRKSLVAQAAHGQAIADPPPAPLDGSLIQGSVQQATYLGGFSGQVGGSCINCGPVCDCVDIGCGAEVIGPACGCEIGMECSCGVEVGCGLEVIGPSCGCEDRRV